MKVLIVSKTRVGQSLCVGGITPGGVGLRLLDRSGHYPPVNTDFEVGQIWEMTYQAHTTPIQPHVEDVLIQDKKLIGSIRNVRQVLLQHVTPWRGDPECLFDGCLCWTSGRRGYISRSTGLPGASTGFWIPDQPLSFVVIGTKPCFIYSAGTNTYCLRYVGYAPVNIDIPARTLVRVSLARWWRPPDDDTIEKRCYLQLSGWYE